MWSQNEQCGDHTEDNQQWGSWTLVSITPTWYEINTSLNSWSSYHVCNSSLSHTHLCYHTKVLYFKIYSFKCSCKKSTIVLTENKRNYFCNFCSIKWVHVILSLNYGKQFHSKVNLFAKRTQLASKAHSIQKWQSACNQAVHETQNILVVLQNHCVAAYVSRWFFSDLSLRTKIIETLEEQMSIGFYCCGHLTFYDKKNIKMSTKQKYEMLSPFKKQL